MVAQWDVPPASSSDFGVAMLRWPAERERAEQLERAGRPFLLLVAADEPPPLSGYRFMDWVRSPVDPDELVARRDNLEGRFVLSVGGPRPFLDEDGCRLSFGRSTVDVSPTKIGAMKVFVECYREIVPFADVRAALELSDDDPEERLSSRLVRLRRFARHVGLDITRVRGVGFSLVPLSPNGDR